MERIPLEERLEKARRQLITNPELVEEMLRSVYAAPMREYLSDEKYRRDLSRAMGLARPLGADRLTMVRVVNVLEDRWCDANTHEQAVEGVWTLAIPYLAEAIKRNRGKKDGK